MEELPDYLVFYRRSVPFTQYSGLAEHRDYQLSIGSEYLYCWSSLNMDIAVFPINLIQDSTGGTYK